MADLKELRNQRGKAIADARALLDKAETEKRELSAEETTQYEALVADSQRLKSTIDREERQQELDREAEKVAGERQETGDFKETGSPRGSKAYHEAFLRMMIGGKESLGPDDLRALSAGVATEGGQILLPEQTLDMILKGVDNLVFIRQRATKYRVPSANSLGVPTLTGDVDDADWTTELGTGAEDTGMKFGKRALYPQKPLAKRVLIGNELMQRLPTIESYAMGRLSYKFAVTHEKAFMTGNGNNQPLGLFTASNDGIPTSRDVSEGNATTAPTFDGLINAKYSLKGQYWNVADWMFHRDCLKILAKIKDGDGQYIWRESVRAGEPDMLLGRPVQMSEYIPNTLTTGQYVGILGDFSYYWIADALDMTMQRLVELYALTNQTALIGRMSTDAMPVLSEAFARIKLG